MKYIKTDWHEDEPDLPVTTYSEVDDREWEVRQIWVRSSGRIEVASASIMPENLSEEPMLPIDVSRKFVTKEISRDEFEQVWKKAVHSQKPRDGGLI